MAKANKIGLIAFGVLKALQSGECSACGQKLDSPFDFPVCGETIRVTNPDDYKTTIAHIFAKSNGGKNTLSNYSLQHFVCNRAFYNFDYAEYAVKSNAVKSHEQVLETARFAVILTSAIQKGKVKMADVKTYAVQEMLDSTEWLRRYSNQVSILGIETL